MKTYSKLLRFSSFEDRFDYLSLHGKIGFETFGSSRFLNQDFYRSKEWKKIRDIVIMRDEGCDLGCIDRPIKGGIIIHHMNPINEQLILDRDESILDPEFLICCSHNTHNAIHYGDKSLVLRDPIIRLPNDTKLW